MIRKVKLKIQAQKLVRLHAYVHQVATEKNRQSLMIDSPQGEAMKALRCEEQLTWRLLDKIQRKLQTSAIQGKGHGDIIKIKLDYPEAYILWKILLESQELEEASEILFEIDPQL